MKHLHTPSGLQEIENSIEELNALTAEDNNRKQVRDTAKAEEDALKASGNQKLLDLGLTQAEATALTGYTPPVSE